MAELESMKILKQRGVEYRLIELEEKAISVEDVIRYSKTDIEPFRVAVEEFLLSYHQTLSKDSFERHGERMFLKKEEEIEMI